VRFVNTRAEEFVTITKHAMTVEVESGVADDGRLLYRSAKLVADGGAYANSSPVIPKASGGAVLGPYRIEAAHVDAAVVYTNHPPAGSFRGLGVSQAAWASEQQMDEIAVALGLSPLELRRRNLVGNGDRIPNGNLAHEAHWLECIEAALDMLDKPGPSDPGATEDDPPWLRRGRGVAVVMKATMSPFKTEVRLSLHADGHVEVRASAVDMGQGARTVMARLTAAALEVSLERVRVIDPDTARTPFDATSSSSRTTYMHAHAIEVAALNLRDRIEEVATVVSQGVPLLSYANGRVSDASGAFDMPFDALLRASERDELVAEGDFVNEPRRDPDKGTPELTSHWHQGAVAVKVAVDIETGRVSVERACGAAWAGRVISVPGARLQNEGNIIYGIGPALFEEVGFSDGVPTTTSLRDYRIPSLRDMPRDLRTVALVHEGDERAYPDGLGESLIPAVAPAVANALADAVGVRIRDLPMSPERVLAAIDATGGEHV
jgi:CO/xanthine dehydrogenase Mo-binding subunit